MLIMITYREKNTKKNYAVIKHNIIHIVNKSICI